MGKNLILFVLVGLFLISLVGADMFKAETDYTIRKSIRLNGAITSTASCNITISDPDQYLLAYFAEMDYDSTAQTYNYTILQANTSKLGNYCYDITCGDLGINKTSSFCDEATPTGKELTSAQGTLYLLLFIVLIAFFILSLYFAITIPYVNERNSVNELIRVNYKKYLKIFSILMCYLFLIWIIFLSWNVAYGFLQLGSLATAFHYLYRLLLGIAFPIFAVVAVFTLYSYINDKKIQKLMDRGLTVT